MCYIRHKVGSDKHPNLKGESNMNKERISVVSKDAAWALANRLFPTDYDRDAQRSENAGYDIYACSAQTENNWICDLGDRLEINLGADTINIWIENPELEAATKEIEQLREVCMNQVHNVTELSEQVAARDAIIAERDKEIVELKAKLYDLIVGGKN